MSIQVMMVPSEGLSFKNAKVAMDAVAASIVMTVLWVNSKQIPKYIATKMVNE